MGIRGIVLLTLWLMLGNGCDSPAREVPVEFEGVITYSLKLESKIETPTDRYFQSMYGDEVRLSIQGGNRRFDFPQGEGITWVIRREGDPLEYSKRPGSDILRTQDLRVEWDEIHSVDLCDRTAVVLGHSLKCVDAHIGETHDYHYYSSEFPADSADFSDHRFGAEAQIMKIARAVPLMFVFDGRAFRKTQTAIRIEPGPVDGSLFEVPDLPLEPWGN